MKKNNEINGKRRMEGMKKLKYICFILFFSGLPLTFCKAQQYLVDYETNWFFRTNLLLNTFENPFKSSNANFEIDIEYYFPKVPLFLGAGTSMYIDFKTNDLYTLKERNLSDWNTLLGSNYYIGYCPLNTRGHRIGLATGYSLAFYVHTPEVPDKVHSDHGILARAFYEYTFTRSMSLGFFTQYIHYFKYETTPDFLSVGFTICFDFL